MSDISRNCVLVLSFSEGVYILLHSHLWRPSLSRILAVRPSQATRGSRICDGLFHKFFNYAWKFRVKRITFGIYLLHFSYYPQKLVCVQMAHKSRVGRPWDVGSMVDWSSHAEGGCIWHWATADAPKVQRWMWWRGLLMPMQNRQYFLQIKQNKRDNHSHVLDVSSDKILHNSRRLFGWKNNGAMEPT